MTDELLRCPWPGDDLLYLDYHDNEWGRPVHDDNKLFEAIILDGFQAGLSWLTILQRREGFRKAFAGFLPEKMADFGKPDIESLMQDTRIIRNRQKIEAAIGNARAFNKVQNEYGSFDTYIWQFTGGVQIDHQLEDIRQMPVTGKESEWMSKDMKQRGFSFCGPTICYAFMQAVGMVNDHLVSCFCHDLCQNSVKK